MSSLVDLNKTEGQAGCLKVAALVSGHLGAQELWALKNISAVRCRLYVIRATQATAVSKYKRAHRLIKEHGLLRTASRLLGGPIGSRVAAKNRKILDELFDVRALEDWWNHSDIRPCNVPTLNHPDSRCLLEKLAPDIIIRVSGGILRPHIFSLAKIATLNIHHGQAPLIRGMWSIPWGIIEGRPDWIGATVHVIDEGIDTGTVLWRGGPQLSPGDTYVDLLFRTHLEVVSALVQILNIYALGETPRPWTCLPNETSAYRSAPGLWEWIKFLRLDQGRRAQVLIRKGIKC
jgi:Formyl transferase